MILISPLPNWLPDLNNAFRSVIQSTPATPGLEASIIVRTAYEPNQLTELTSVKDQLWVSLNLSTLPIKDDDLSDHSFIQKTGETQS